MTDLTASPQQSKVFDGPSRPLSAAGTGFTTPPPLSDGTRFPLRPEQIAKVERMFTYHAPKGSQLERYAALRDKAKELGLLILECVPEGREQALALTQLQLATMVANAGIACNE